MFPGEFPFFAGLLNFHWSIRNQITIFYQLYRHQPPFSHDFPQVFPGFSQVVPIQNPQRRPKDYELLVFSEQDTVFVHRELLKDLETAPLGQPGGRHVMMGFFDH